MTTDEPLNLIRTMRQAQKAYFKTRDFAELLDARRLEIEVDRELDARLKTELQKEMF